MTAQLSIARESASLWRVTFSNPPINMFVPTTIVELGALMTDLEADASVKVVVFESANPEFFVAHLDVAKAAERPEALGLWRDFVLRLSSTPVVSIAKIRGRTRGIGNEFVLACDMRFASRQSACSAIPRSASDWSRAAARWNGSRVWSAARARLRSCSAATISMPISPSAMAG